MGRIRQLISRGRQTGRCLEMDSIWPVSRIQTGPRGVRLVRLIQSVFALKK
jgi:hypothetical protein